MFFKPAFWMHVLVSMLKKFHFQLSKHTTGLYHATPVRDVIYSENGTVIVVYRVILKGTDGEVSFLTFSLWSTCWFCTNRPSLWLCHAVAN